MTNKIEVIEKINKYLTRRFICDPKLLPDDECESEAREILKMLESLGMVFKDEDQGLPENPYPVNMAVPSARESVYGEAQQDMLKAGWVKVEKE